MLSHNLSLKYAFLYCCPMTLKNAATSVARQKSNDRSKMISSTKAMGNA